MGLAMIMDYSSTYWDFIESATLLGVGNEAWLIATPLYMKTSIL